MRAATDELVVRSSRGGIRRVARARPPLELEIASSDTLCAENSPPAKRRDRPIAARQQMPMAALLTLRACSPAVSPSSWAAEI
eukprot:4614579-Alexandrium_andersonii.AAC.1